MHEPALRALLRLEIKRTLPLTRRALVMAVVVAVVLFLTDLYTAPRMAYVIAVLGGAVSFTLSANAVRDKVEGGMEFLRSLPMSPSTHTAGRFLGAAVMSIPGALSFTVATVLMLPEGLSGLTSPQALVGIFLGFVALVTTLGFVVLALLLRLETSQLGYVPLPLLAALLILGHFTDRLVPDPAATTQRLLAQAWFLPVAWAVLLAAVALVGWGSFAVARAGITNFKPGRDRITW